MRGSTVIIIPNIFEDQTFKVYNSYIMKRAGSYGTINAGKLRIIQRVTTYKRKYKYLRTTFISQNIHEKKE